MWEVDFEACQLLLRGFQLKEAGGCVSEGEDSQTDEVEDPADASLSTKRGQSKCFPITDSERSALQHHVTRSKHPSEHWELNEVSMVLFVLFCFSVYFALMSFFSFQERRVCSGLEVQQHWLGVKLTFGIG